MYIIIKFECNLKIAPFIILNTILFPIYFEYHYSTLKSKFGLTDNNKTLSETGVYFWGSVSGGICLHVYLHWVWLRGGSASKAGLHPRLYFWGVYLHWVCLQGCLTNPPILTSGGGHCSGRYASYWNVFLFNCY